MQTTNSSSFEALLYSGQFVLGPSVANCFETPKVLKIDESLILTAHTELNTAQAFDDKKSLTLIGFIIDPDNPEASDVDILNRLLSNCSNAKSLIEYTSRCGGRWILIATNGKQKYLFNDALGLRQVFYSNPKSSESLWAMSQPGLGADLLRLSYDDIALEYMDSFEFRSNPEYRWPGIATAYKEIKHLLPNHYLDLITGTCHRYWPDKALERITPDEAINEISSLLQNLMKGIALRFDLAVGITAGLDSRLVLAASKEICNKLSFITVRQGRMSDDNHDIVVPAMLLPRLSLQHHIIKSAASMTPDFSRTFKKNVFLAHDIYGTDAEAIYSFFPHRKVAVTGSGAEVGRCSFRKQLSESQRQNITPEDLSRLQKMGKNDFVINNFSNWLNSIEKKYNLNILDLFEWEQGHGNWLAMTQLEFNIAWRDIFTPFNCRNVLTTMLSVDEKYRNGPDYSLFKNLILKLWPETLCEPINPDGRKKRPKRFRYIRKILSLIKRLIV